MTNIRYVYGLSLYVALENTSTFKKSDGVTTTVNVRSCTQWEISALTMTLAWINLPFHLRLGHKIGKYIILFQNIVVSFIPFFVVIIILLIGFGLSFHLLLSHRDSFANPEDALLKTLMMMSGEIEYGEMFEKDRPPLGWGDDYDQGPEHVPFPVVTYTIFIAFFFLVCLVALNAFIGLTVGETKKLIEDAQVHIIAQRLRLVLELDHDNLFFKKIFPRIHLYNRIEKGSSFERGLTEDLPQRYSGNGLFDRLEARERSRIQTWRKNKETEEEKELIKQLASQNLKINTTMFDISKVLRHLDMDRFDQSTNL